MSLHPDTVSVLEKNKHNFTKELWNSIELIMELIEKYSAMSDVNYILHKSGQTIPQIGLPKGEVSWLPIRNLIRLIAKIASLEVDQISAIEIKSMVCGCDYFEGDIGISIGDHKVSGPYKWQWTAFQDRIRNYNKFTVFPEIAQKIIVD